MAHQDDGSLALARQMEASTKRQESCKYPFKINVTRRCLAENYSLSLHVVKKIMSLLYRRTELGQQQQQQLYYSYFPKEQITIKEMKF